MGAQLPGTTQFLMHKRCLFLVSFVAVAGLACAQSELAGPDNFPQFRGLSALPGGGICLMPDGNPGADGALAFSTPVGFALGHYRLNFGLSVVSDSGKFVGFRNSKFENEGNGTGYIMGGAELGSVGRASVSFMVLSSFGDNAWNIQFQPGRQEGPVWYSVGVQDVFGHGGSSGEGFPGDDQTSRSFYGVATGRVAENTYVSLGGGSRRFQKGFFNASTNISPDFKGMVEHDGFNWNLGVAYTLGTDHADPARSVTMFLGYVRGKYLTWSLGASY